MVGDKNHQAFFSLETAQSRCFEPKPIENVVETDGMRKLSKEHGFQVAQNTEFASLCVPPFLRAL